jgi:[acyl-carrier-protein] S-malonyltransferase
VEPVGKIAFAFPGQGSQKVGMGRGLAEKHPVVASTFEEADRVLGFSLSRLCWEGPGSELELTANTQPALLACSIATERLLSSEGIYPDLVLGHSLGEYSALVAAGTLEFSDALKLVRARGHYMQEAVPVGRGSMAALMGLKAGGVEAVCDEARAAGEVLSPANLNAPGQVVVAGHAASVEKAIELARSHGARRAVRLPVSAPFHCALMKPAEERLALDLDGVDFRDPRVPLVTNVDAKLISRGADARDALRRQVSGTVRWEESVRGLRAEGVGLIVEVGPGKVLSGLIRRTDEKLAVESVEDEAGLARLRERLGKPR